MKKILLSLTVIFSFIFYAITQKNTNSNQAKSEPIPVSTVQPIVSSSPSGNQKSSGQYKDGEYTGNVTDAYYGDYQVKAIISGGQIADIQFLQYPNDRRTSIEINTQSMPILKQEAIKAQNADVDIVTGATQSSQAFKESLQSALIKAKV